MNKGRYEQTKKQMWHYCIHLLDSEKELITWRDVFTCIVWVVIRLFNLILTRLDYSHNSRYSIINFQHSVLVKIEKRKSSRGWRLETGCWLTIALCARLSFGCMGHLWVKHDFMFFFTSWCTFFSFSKETNLDFYIKELPIMLKGQRCSAPLLSFEVGPFENMATQTIIEWHHQNIATS